MTAPVTLSSYVSALAAAVIDAQSALDAAADADELLDRPLIQQLAVRVGFVVATTRTIGFEIGVWPLNAGFSVAHGIRHTDTSWVRLEFVRVPTAAP
jgi:hypothetical protein